MRLSLALACTLLVACESDPDTSPMSDGSTLLGTLAFGAVCEDSTQCVSRLCAAVSMIRDVCTRTCTDRAGCPGGESWDCVPAAGQPSALCACTSNSSTEICGDGRDNDCDGITDCPTDTLDGGIPDSSVPDGSQEDGSVTCPTGDCEPEPTCATDPGLCPLCEENIDCDDGKFCTEDVCRAGGCVHISRDNGCDATEICDPRSSEGCVAAKACASDADCTDEDACTQFEYCDTTAAICRYQILDADRDDHLPMVCGGDDCNDNDERAYPGALDICDNRDNNCDGLIDPPSAALLCADGRMCATGVCLCETGLQDCLGSCVDPAAFQTDANNCGGCGLRCATGELCIAGLCDDLDECEITDDICPVHSICVNFEPGYDCECDAYYVKQGDLCVDENECTAAEDDGCDSDPPACVNTTNGYHCACPSGYTGDGIGAVGCADIDECDTPNRCPGDHVQCTNSPGSYECECEDGYLADAGNTCGDYDECARALDECDDSPGDCTDEVGGYSCACPATHLTLDSGHGALGCASRVTALASSTGGSGLFCAMLTGGRVQCWGTNGYGQVGVGSTTDQGTELDHLVDANDVVNLGTGRTAKAIAVGGLHVCAILDNDSIKCWGYNAYGQLGLGTTLSLGAALSDLGDSLAAVALGTGRTAKAITAGNIHTCAILDNNSVKCWGANANGQLGRDNALDWGFAQNQMGDALAAINLGAGRTAKQISAGGDHTCAILDNDTVKCWGNNFYGQLGEGTNSTRGDNPGEMAALMPVSLGAGLTAKAISAGTYHSCAILNNDSIKCWGQNNYGELGINSTTARGDGAGEMGDALPTAILGAGRTAKTLVAGFFTTCALLDNDTLKCWGYNEYGQLGLGTTTSVGGTAGSMQTLVGISLGTGLTPTGIASSVTNTCAVFSNQRVKCWGQNGYGDLGQGDFITRGDNAGEMGDSLLFSRLGG